MTYDIALNITLHAENDLLFKTFKSIGESIKYLKNTYPDIRLLANVSLDRPTNRTKEVFSNSRQFIEPHVDKFQFFEVDFGDLSSSRNNLIEKSLKNNAKYIQFFDGDDLYSRNYISEIYSTAVSANRPVAVYAGKLVFIQGLTGLMDKAGIYSASNSPTTSIDCLYSENLWTAVIFCDSQILKDLRYVKIGSPYRFEDWHMTMRILSSGYDILVADKALYMYRSKLQGSLFQETLNNNRLCIAPCRFFEPDYFRSINHISSEDIKKTVYDSYPIVAISNKMNAKKERFVNIRLHKSPMMNVLLYGKRMVKELAKGVLLLLGYNRMLSGNKINHNTTKDNYDRLKKIGFDNEILKEIDFLSTIEPIAVRDDDWVNRVVVYFTTRPTTPREVYRKLCLMENSENVDRLFVVSGNESESALSEIAKNITSNSLVIMASKTCSKNNFYQRIKAKGLLFGGMEDFGDMDYGDGDIELLLLRFIQNSKNLKEVVVARSPIGYRLIDNMADEIKKTCPIHVYFDGYDNNDRGLMVDSSIIEDIYCKVDKIIVANKCTANNLGKINGWSIDNIQIGLK